MILFLKKRKRHFRRNLRFFFGVDVPFLGLNALAVVLIPNVHLFLSVNHQKYYNGARAWRQERVGSVFSGPVTHLE